MKIELTTRIGLATVLAVSTQFAVAQTADLTLHTFDADIADTGVMWGSGSNHWDAAEDATGNGGGSLRMTSTWYTNDGSGNTLNNWIGLPGANPWWYGSGTINLSEYSAIEFDLKWDTSSDATIDQWNSPTTWPGVGNANGFGMEVMALANTSGGRQSIGSINVPALAASGWVKMSVPIDPAQANIDPCVGVVIAKWMHYPTSVFATNHFWIDNVVLKGTAGPPPPPTMSLREPGSAGVQITTSETGNQWQRESLVTPDAAGTMLWGGYGANPVTYSFTIADFPDPVVNHGFQAHMFLFNGDNLDEFQETWSSADWNAADLAVVRLTGNGNGTFDLSFSWKTNMPAANPPDDPIHAPATVTNIPSALGTWSLSFTHNTNVTLSGPGGVLTNFTIPNEAVVNYFTPATEGFIHFGAFKNDGENDGHNDGEGLVYSRLTKTGGDYTFDDMFDGSELTNNYAWRRTSADEVLHIGPDTEWLVDWTAPASGFSLQSAADINGPWGEAGASTTVQVGDTITAQIPGSSLPSTDSTLWRLIKREASKLQILLPGETAAPGTPSGKTGTPTPVAAYDYVNITVRVVDADWHLISGRNDIVTFSSTDPFPLLPDDGAVTDGEGVFEMQFSEPGSQTVTVSNLTDPSILPDTSSSITVN